MPTACASASLPLASALAAVRTNRLNPLPAPPCTKPGCAAWPDPSLLARFAGGRSGLDARAPPVAELEPIRFGPPARPRSRQYAHRHTAARSPFGELATRTVQDNAQPVDYLTGALSIAVATTRGLCRGVGRRRLRRAAPTSLAEGSHESAWVMVPAGAAASIISYGRLDCLGLADAL